MHIPQAALFEHCLVERRLKRTLVEGLFLFEKFRCHPLGQSPAVFKGKPGQMLFQICAVVSAPRVIQALLL